jgi:hypothetical protein
MISLRNHDRVGRTSARLSSAAPLPGLDERVAMARGWAASTPQPAGTRRDLRRPPTSRQLPAARGDAVSSVLDPVVEGLDLADHEVAELRAFAARMMRDQAPRTDRSRPAG